MVDIAKRLRWHQFHARCVRGLSASNMAFVRVKLKELRIIVSSSISVSKEKPEAAEVEHSVCAWCSGICNFDRQWCDDHVCSRPFPGFAELLIRYASPFWCT